MILLAFLSIFLFFFHKGATSLFLIKANHSVCLLHCVIATEFDYSLNIKHELRSKKIKQFCVIQTFPNNISWFAT